MTTNRNRHCFFGPSQKNWHITYEPSDGAFIAGIYASWGYWMVDEVSILMLNLKSEVPLSLEALVQYDLRPLGKYIWTGMY